jgi:hypothetical protein
MMTAAKSLPTYGVVCVLALFLSACDWPRDDKEANGEKVTLAQLPPAAKATIEQESKGGTVKETQKITKDGKTVYSTDIVVNGKEQEVIVAEDGTVIERGGKDDDD